MSSLHKKGRNIVKYLIFLVLLLFLRISAFTQVTFSDWIVRSGIKGWDIVNGLACDSNGNVYITGSNTDTTLGLRSEKIATKTKKFNFLSKFDTSGKLLWNRKIVTNEAGYGGLLFITPKNQIYLEGAEVSAKKSKSIDQKHINFFLSSLTPDGKIKWVQQFSGNKFDYFTSLTVDSITNDILLAGYFYDTLDLHKTKVISKGKSDGVFLRFSNDGQLLKSFTIGGKKDDRINSITVDKWGNNCIAGTFQDKIQLGENNPESVNTDNTGVFLAKYDLSGECIAAKQCCWGKNLSVASSANNGRFWIITGSFSDFLNINGQSMGSYGSDDVFVICVDALMNLRWYKHIGGSKKDKASLVKFEGNDIILTGSFCSKLNFDNNSITSLKGSSDIFILSLDTTGKINWSKQMGGEYDDYPRCIETAKNDYIYISGSFRESLNNLDNIQSKGEEDIFVARLEDCKKKAPKFKKPETFCQGDTLSLDAGGGFISYNWNNGLCLQRNILIKQPGDYSLVLQNKNGCIVYDTVKVIEIPSPDVFIGKDTTITDSTILVLKTNTKFKDYLWSTGSKEPTIIVHGFNCLEGPNRFWVQVDNDYRCKGYAEILVSKTKTKPSIVSEALSTSCVIFPNPATNRITVYFTSSLENLELKMFDLFGKELVSRTISKYLKFDQINFDVENYPPGLLTLTIKSKDGFTTKKIILQE